MPNRREALERGLSRTRAAALAKERGAFEDFRRTFGLAEGPEVVALYLSWLAQPGVSGRAIRHRLALLDLDRRLRGGPAWSEEPEVRTFLRGLHSHVALDSSGQRSDPLYVELVHALVDATMLPNLEHLRAVAAILLADATDLPAAVLARMTWDNVHLTKKRVVVTVTRRSTRGVPFQARFTVCAEPGNDHCVPSALRRLRRASPPGNRFVFGSKGNVRDHDRVLRFLAPLRRRDRTATVAVKQEELSAALATATEPGPTQLRDRALFLVAFAGALGAAEASNLRCQDIQVEDAGLRLRVAGRKGATYIPTAAECTYDAAAAWTAWSDRLSEQDCLEGDAAAFPHVNQSHIWPDRMSNGALNYAVHQRCSQAALIGTYTFTSLRTGMMRTAIRADIRSHSIAAHADLRTLGAVQRHERRENLLRHNIAAMLGL